MSRPPGPFNPAAALQEALALHQRGRLDEAEKLYTRVLKAQRDNFDALHLSACSTSSAASPARPIV